MDVPISRMLRTALRIGAVTVTLLGAAAVATTVANAATGEICEDFGLTNQGNYVVMNNKWNAEATGEQCIDVTANGFQVTTQSNELSPTDGAPASFPAIYLGCHRGINCSDNSLIPKQLKSMSSINSSITWNLDAPGTYNAAYDIWLDSTPDREDENQAEIMIWFTRTSEDIRAIGSPTGKATISGHEWTVWTGVKEDTGTHVVSYVADTPFDSLTFDSFDFIRDTFARDPESGDMDWYLTSIQAGFEIWNGGVGLAVTSFDVAIEEAVSPRATKSTGQ